jgi:hypothetical protein
MALSLPSSLHSLNTVTGCPDEGNAIIFENRHKYGQWLQGVVMPDTLI